MCVGSLFQAVGAAIENEQMTVVRGISKSPRAVDRRRGLVHGCCS